MHSKINSFPVIKGSCVFNPASEASAVTNCANLRFLIYMYVAVRPFGPAWAPCNAQCANVGPAGRGSMVNIIALSLVQSWTARI